MEAMESALTEHDLTTVARLAHSLKSSVKSIGAGDIVKLCQRLEQTGRSIDSNEANRAFGHLKASIALLLKELKEYSSQEKR